MSGACYSVNARSEAHVNYFRPSETFYDLQVCGGYACARLGERRQFVSVTRTDAELSIVAETDFVPGDLPSAIPNWRVMKVHGPFDLSVVGVLASLVTPLAQKGISVFTISTFDTDYLLVQSNDLKAAAAALRNAGHSILKTESTS